MTQTLATAWAALLLTLMVVVLHRTTRNPKIAAGDAVLMDLGLGLSAMAAATFWTSALLRIAF